MKLNYKRTFFVGLAFMSICAFWQVYDNLVPLILKNTFHIKDTLIGVVMALDNVLALIMLPMFGKFSDKTKTRLGKRMPYILGGTVVAVVCVMLLPIAERIHSLLLFFFGLGMVLLAMATYRSPAVALMPDVTPKSLRSQANAVINLMGSAGGMLMLFTMQMLLPKAHDGEYRPDYLPIYVVLAVVMSLCVATLLWKVKENACAQEAQHLDAAYGSPSADEKDTSKEVISAEMSPAVRRSFCFILASVFLWYMGYNAVISGFSRYATQELKGSFSMILMVCTASAILSYLPVGFVAAKIGRKKTILLGVLFLGIAFAAGGFFREVTVPLYVFFILTGMGWAFINVNSYPMVVELASGSNVGKYTGYYYTVSMAAQIITPVCSGFLMGHVGYRTLFPYAAFFVFASFVTMCMVKHGDSRPAAKKGLDALDVDD